MPRGKSRDIEIIDGWAMKWKKTNKKTGEDIYYCAERTRASICNGAFLVNNFTHTFKVLKPHVRHDKDDIANQAKIARQELKRLADTGPTRMVIDQVRAAFDPAATVMLGSYEAKRKILYHAKQHPEPDTLAMDRGGPIAAKFTTTIDGSPFLLYETVGVFPKMLIFASPSGLDLLSQSNVIMVDGTFDSTPEGYEQLFTIHSYISESVVRPVVFALLENKRTSTYESFLDELLKQPILSNWRPGVVISDYEVAIRSAFETKFTGIQVQGCLFHLIQAWRRRAEKSTLYKEFSDGSYQKFWKLLKCLPFIQPAEIGQYFGELVGILPQNISKDLNDFLLYLQNNYININNSTPRFPPTMWSCHLRTVNYIQRTTNSVECWHRTLDSVINKYNGLSKLKMSDLLCHIRSEERHTKLDAAELAVNPNFQVNKSRTVTSVLRDAKVLKVLQNTAIPPNQPLSGIQLLENIYLARK